MCCVDLFSRKAFVTPIKSKSGTSVGMREVLNIQKPILIQSDKGTEFINHTFQELLKEKGIRHTAVEVGDHRRQGIVERFNKTIESIIIKYHETRNTNRSIDILSFLIY